MNNKLQKVGLIFTEEGAIDFKKTLQDINIELQKNYNQFKVTQAQWDKSTSKTEKLRAEQENLKNAYELQTDKIAVLKMQLEELENAEDKNVTAIKKKNNELTSAEIKAENYRKKISNLDEEIKKLENQTKLSGEQIEKFGEQIEKSGDKIESAGKKITSTSVVAGAALVGVAKSAIDFDDAFTGVEKTVDGTDEQLEILKQGIRDMATEIPASAEKIAEVAEAAGQLGIKTEDILSFTRVMIDLGNSTNLSAEEAASALAKFANITKMSASDYERLGATIVDLGNNFATTEADIVSMATRLAATGDLAGLSEAQILALAAAMSSVGIEAEAGGSAMSKLLKQIQVAVETGSDDLKDFSKVAGMSVSEFKRAFEDDAISALSKFITGLNDTERNGKSAIAILEDMGLTEVRLSNTILSLANSGDLLNNAIETGNNAWKENTALTNEASKRYANFKSQLQIAVNKLKDLAITFGDKVTPVIPKVTKAIESLTNWIGNLTDEQVELILKITACSAAIGPFLTILGKVVSIGGNTVKAIGTITQAIEVMRGNTTSTSTAVNTLAGVFTAISSPAGIATLALAGIAAAIISIKESSAKANETFEQIQASANDFSNGIESASSHLDSFNSKLFASSEEQIELSNQMSEIQENITKICQTASNERRNYTQEEIKKLDEYFQELRELNQRELEIQQSISAAISQQAQTAAQTFNGSLEEYKILSQEWIKTAEEQRDKTIELIENQTTEEIVLLNQRYGTQATMRNENYAREYNEILAQKQKKIDATNEEVALIIDAYSSGYEKRLINSDDFKAKKTERNLALEEEERRYSEEIKKIEEDLYSNTFQKQKQKELADEIHQANIEAINRKMVNSLEQRKTDEIGVLTGLLNESAKYRDKSETTAEETVDKIVAEYKKLPGQTRTVMKDAMLPLEEEMDLAAPRLYRKADDISFGISSRLKKGFDEHSPSKVTRKIMRFAMQPMEEEMEKSKKTLFKSSDEIAEGVTNKLNNINGNRNNSINDYSVSSYQIDYDKLEKIVDNALNKVTVSFLKSLNSCKFTLDEDGFVRIVRDELLKVM